MGRLLAFILGGAALALYGPHLFPGDIADNVETFWRDLIQSDDWYERIFKTGPGLFAGLALILIATRGGGGD